MPASPNASIEAAAAQAAHDVLTALFPTRRAIFDTEVANSLVGIPENRAQQGIIVGEIVAERLLAARANDGWNATPPPYFLPMTAGNWQPAPAPAGFTHFPAVWPFAITSNSQFAPNPPPAMTSAEYAAGFNQVKELGSATSTTRTADQHKSRGSGQMSIRPLPSGSFGIMSHAPSRYPETARPRKTPDCSR